MNTLRLIRWRGERHASITQRLNFAAHATPEATLALVYAHESGLEPDEVRQARRAYGGNTIPAPDVHESPARRLVRAFMNPFIGVLMLLALTSFVCSLAQRGIVTSGTTAANGGGTPVTVGIILLMAVVSGLIRYVHDSRSSHAATALATMVSTTATVRRVGAGERQIPSEELVVGDIVTLSAGDIVPADCKLLESRDLRIAQGALTGESMPVRKDAAALLAAGARDTALTDAACLVFMGTTVISGSALAVVIATGRSALFGGLSRAFQWQRPRTRFERGMNSTSWMLMAFTAVTVPVSMLVTGIASGDWLQALLFGVSVAVGLTPEMLPLIVTVCLSRGARTMASGKAIVRRLDAIETLGGMDVLCVDKTGTLTSGVIKLDRAQSMSGLNSSYVLHAAWLTTLIPHTTSNPWDDAIVAAEGDSANDTGDVQVEGGTPFDPIRRRATVIVAKSHHRADREHTGGSDISETSGAGAGTSGNVSRIMVVKGAVSEMLPRCDTVMRNGTAEPLTDRLRGTYERLMADKATHGYRVLLVAQRSVTDQTTVQDDRALTLLGYLTFLDLPKPDAADTIAHMHNAGITVTMLTGDEPQVARTVARKVGINARRVVTGRTLDDMTDTALGTELRRVNVFAKLTPEHKARIVSLLRREGHCVGYMGDGVNDLPAMHASEIAISASTGSEAVRQSADVMLTHKNLDVLLRGITQSRRTCVNMMKYIKLALSSNFGNIISVMIAGAFLPFVPMEPVQMVLLNLIYDLACLAIPWDRVDGDVLRSPARWDTASIARFMSRFGPVSSLFDMVTFTVLLTLLCPAVAGGRFPELHGDGSRLLFVAAFQTGWFVVSMWTQITALHMLRTERVPFIGSRASVPLVCTSLAALTIHGAAVHAGRRMDGFPRTSGVAVRAARHRHRRLCRDGTCRQNPVSAPSAAAAVTSDRPALLRNRWNPQERRAGTPALSSSPRTTTVSRIHSNEGTDHDSLDRNRHITGVRHNPAHPAQHRARRAHRIGTAAARTQRGHPHERAGVVGFLPVHHCWRLYARGRHRRPHARGRAGGVRHRLPRRGRNPQAGCVRVRAQHRGHAMGVGGGRHVVRLRHGSARRNRGHRHHARQHDAPADRRGHRRPAHRAIA